jgi:hypothetical protein
MQILGFHQELRLFFSIKTSQKNKTQPVLENIDNYQNQWT